MKHALLAALLAAAPLAAQEAPPDAEQRAAVAQTWQTSRAEFSRVLTCVQLHDPQTRETAEGLWREMVQSAAEKMALGGYQAAEIAEEVGRSGVEDLRLPGDTPFAQVIAFCAEDPEWSRKLAIFNVTLLDTDIAHILGRFE